MTKADVAKLRVGSEFADVFFHPPQRVVKIDGIMYECKVIHEDGSLSAGSEWFVPSHFDEYYEVIKF